MSTPTIGAMFRCDLEPEHLHPFSRQIEAAGYGELWIVEDCFFAGGVASVASALAVTERIVVGIGILPAVMRNVATSAMEFAALARLHPGRVHGGFGHGVADWMRQIGAFPPSQLAALGETTEVVRRLLAGESVTIDGKYVHLDDVRLDHPPRVVPPISVGVQGAKSLRLGGQVADGTVLSELASPAYVRWAREQINAGRDDVGRNDPHRVTVYACFAVGDDSDAIVRAKLAERLRHYYGTAHFDPLGISADVAELVARHPDDASLADAIPAEWVRRLAVSGTPAQCAESIRALADAGADSVVLLPLGDTEAALDQLEQGARDVMPLL